MKRASFRRFLLMFDYFSESLPCFNLWIINIDSVFIDKCQVNQKEQRELINNSRTKFSKDYWISFLECESSSLFKIFHQIYSHAYCYFHNNLESMNEVSKLFLQFRTYLNPLLFKIDVSHFRNIDVSITQVRDYSRPYIYFWILKSCTIIYERHTKNVKLEKAMHLSPFAQYFLATFMYVQCLKSSHFQKIKIKKISSIFKHAKLHFECDILICHPKFLQICDADHCYKIANTVFCLLFIFLCSKIRKERVFREKMTLQCIQYNTLSFLQVFVAVKKNCRFE